MEKVWRILLLRIIKRSISGANFFIFPTSFWFRYRKFDLLLFVLDIWLCHVTGSTYTSSYTTKHLFITDDVIQIFKEANRRLNFYSRNKLDYNQCSIVWHCCLSRPVNILYQRFSYQMSFLLAIMPDMRF